MTRNTNVVVGNCLVTALLIVACARCAADAFVGCPTPPGGHVGDPPETPTLLPFAIKFTVPGGTSSIPTMRYQQVYNKSLFTNVDASLIYITTLTFYIEPTKGFSYGWRVPRMQINLSTTTNAADGLSSLFSANVGADDTVVFGPGEFDFPGGYQGSPQWIPLKRPFRYSAERGNLLLDVRIFDGSDPIIPVLQNRYLWAYNTSTDEVSRVWSTNVAAIAADGSDTVGLQTLIQFSPIPSLHIYTSYFGTPTNWIAVEWPTWPTVFMLQRSATLGSRANWQSLTNVGGGPSASFQRYYFPVNTAGPVGFFRLVWPSGP